MDGDRASKSVTIAFFRFGILVFRLFRLAVSGAVCSVSYRTTKRSKSGFLSAEPLRFAFGTVSLRAIDIQP